MAGICTGTGTKTGQFWGYGQGPGSPQLVSNVKIQTNKGVPRGGAAAPPLLRRPKKRNVSKCGKTSF